MKLLDGIWDFAFSETSDTIPNQFPFSATVPGCFDCSPEFGGKRGTGFYRQFIKLDKDLNYRLILHGVAHNADVYLDRKLIASHHGGFTGFFVDLNPEVSANHELIIAADNRFDGLERPLHMPHFDWYSYGGIIRSVTLEPWSKVLIERIEPIIKDWKSGTATLRLFIQADKKIERPLTVEVFYENGLLKSDSIENFQQPAEIEIQIPSAKPWSPENPQLYKLDIQIADARKSLNIGFRNIRTEGNQILLNDEPIRLRGVNRHDSSVQFGFAIPPAMHLYDIQKIKELGCNFVRTSHYPPGQVFLDLCDREGILVWCEPSAWQYDEQMMNDPRTISAQQNSITEMIEQYGHHPSIICWGLLNECDSSSLKTRHVYEKLISQVRKLDSSRPVTYATCYVFARETFEETEIQDVMFDLVDWISINIYPGWYEGGPEDCNQRMDFVMKCIEKQQYNKPIIISEIGSGGIPGFEHYYPIKWSLSYQEILMERLIEYIRQNSMINGVAIWHFADILTGDDLWKRRPRQYNNKGLLDEFRRPKPVFGAIKKIYHDNW